MNKKLSLIHLVAVLTLLIFALSTHAIVSQSDGLLHIYVLDVGQGDAFLIEAPNGTQVLIDGGPGNAVLEELGKVMPFYDRNLDAIISTQGDADHVSGLVDVLERYSVGMIVQTNIEKDTATFKAWQKAVEAENTVGIEAVAGKKIDMGDGVVIHILFPLVGLEKKVISKVNDLSVVAMLDYNDFEMVFTGDIEAKGESQLLASGQGVRADVLKIAHHGSKTSTTQEFLDAVRSNLSLISVGKNSYGHPSPEVTDRLESSSIPYYRTDVNGRIELRSDGEHFSVQTEK